MKRVLVAAIVLMMAGLAWAQQTVFDAPTLTITTGGTSQQVFSYNESRRFLLIENPVAATETLFCNFGAAASLTLGTSFSLMAGGSFYAVMPNFVPKDTVNCNATTTAHAFVAKEG
jgi:hypothetical protein